MEITKLSSKGQVVIPDSIRKNLEIGTVFNVIRKDSLIILKELEGIKKEEIKEMEELNKIWREIDKGNCITMTKEDFLKEIESW